MNEFRDVVESVLDRYAASLNPDVTVSYWPEHIYVEPTNACNLRCVHCYHARRGRKDEGGKTRVFHKKTGFMDMAVFERVLEQIRGKIPRVSITGHGEPTLHPKLPGMVEKAAKAGFYVSVLTNATRLTEDLGRKLIDAGLDRVVMSHEGSMPQLHEQTRINSGYKTTERNLLRFLKLNCSRGHPVFVCVSMVASGLVIDDAEAFSRRYGEFPVDNIFVNRQLNFSGLISAADDTEWRTKTLLPAEQQPVCISPWFGLTVNWDGGIQACPVDYNGEASHIGDIMRETIEQIWNGEMMRRFRQRQLDRDFRSFPDGLCRQCNCRFWPESNLLDQREFAVNHIVRQAKMYDARLGERRRDSPEKLAALERRLAEVEAMPDDGPVGKCP
jgi:MoaA/NifB/PqqE/SkfB family radical SAM enzyme